MSWNEADLTDKQRAAIGRVKVKKTSLTDALTKDAPPLKPRQRREAAFQKSVEDLLTLKRWRIYHTRNSRGSHPGFPDIIAVRGSRLLALELKVYPNRPTKAQIDWLEALNGVEGCEGRVCYPDQWDVLMEHVG